MSLEITAESIHRCFRCGYCKFPADYEGFICPAYNRFRMESSAPGGMLWLIRAMMVGEIEVGPELSKILYGCTMCSNCADKCPMDFGHKITDMIISARNSVVEKPGIPKSVRIYLENMMAAGNPWKKSQSKRGEWNKNNRFPQITEQMEYLFYVGDSGSYTEKGKEIAYMLGELLELAGCRFGVLGSEEKTDGNEVQKMGEQDLFEHLAGQNISDFKKKGITKICTLSPHAFHTFKNDYPDLNGRFEVCHYSELLKNYTLNQQLGITGVTARKVTFHDPCFLGRWNREYEAARDILNAIPGIELIEMRRNRANALCCGGGGGNFFTDMLGNTEQSPARVRVREAMQLGVEVLAVACPMCRTMLEEAAKSENLDQALEVRDVIEIVHEAVME